MENAHPYVETPAQNRGQDDAMDAKGEELLGHHGFRLPKVSLFRRSNRVFDDEFGFYSEEYFREMLAMERKRTERSQKPIILVMIDIAGILDSVSRKQIVRHLTSLLTVSAREIDVKGWYRYNHTVGIIYTETTPASKDSILQKIHLNLGLALGPEIAGRVIVTYALFPEINDVSGGKDGHVADVRFYPSPYSYSPSKKVSLMMKRVVDVVGSSVLILLFLPFFVLIAALIKFTSRGPVFFTQTRVGQGGKSFRFIKFRSMIAGNDSSLHRDYVKKLIQGEADASAQGAHGVYKITNDPRVTPVGRILRKTSLDEIPQLFNVLKGDMALVGPRPPIPYELENYHIWHRRRVLEAKPGITGFWQVAGRSTTTFDTMVRMDLQYVMRWSLWWDIKLILRTPLAVLKGAY
jgi:lipopolysaccharide/colanic/teichoic acid biosynthesis glycosyltransferase